MIVLVKNSDFCSVMTVDSKVKRRLNVTSSFLLYRSCIHFFFDIALLSLRFDVGTFRRLPIDTTGSAQTSPMIYASFRGLALAAMACQLTITNGFLPMSPSPLSPLKNSGELTTHRTSTSSVTLSMAADTSAVSSLTPLISGDGSTCYEDDLKERFQGKRVALYFSAGWCPMCTSFEPALMKFKAAAEDSGKPVEIVYVPSDRSESDAGKRAESMGMVAVPFEKADDYKKSFGVWAGSEALKFGFGGRRSGVPALVVLDPQDGSELAFVAAESQGATALGSWPLDDGVW